MPIFRDDIEPSTIPFFRIVGRSFMLLYSLGEANMKVFVSYMYQLSWSLWAIWGFTLNVLSRCIVLDCRSGAFCSYPFVLDLFGVAWHTVGIASSLPMCQEPSYAGALLLSMLMHGS